jgi:hypothetical protein
MIRVVRTKLSGMYVRYTAWEPAAGGDVFWSDSHSAVSTDEHGNLLGRVGQRRLPVAIGALPKGPDRDVAIEHFLAEQHETAYAAILAEFPEVDLGERLRGTITTPQCELREKQRVAVRRLGAELGAYFCDSLADR